MNKGHLLLGLFKAVVLFSTLGVSMNACASGGASWKEEVLLHDGSKITVERSFNLGGYPTIDSRERQALDETVTFALPGSGKKITWRTEFRDSVEEPNSLNLLILDIVSGIPYLASYPAGCIAYNKWKRPNPPYIFFKYVDNEWKRISLEEFPAKLSQTNVIVGRPPTELAKPFYTVEGVKERNQGLQEQYLTILRTEIKSAGEGCPKLVRIKGGWASPDGAKSPIPIVPRNSDDKK